MKNKIISPQDKEFSDYIENSPEKPSLLEFLEEADENEPIDLEKITEYLTEIFMEDIDIKKPPSDDNMYIKIYHGWSTTDETDENRYYMFSASIPSRGMMMTGLGGFLLFVDDWAKGIPIPIVYNGQLIPDEDKNRFLKFCRDLNNGTDEEE